MLTYWRDFDRSLGSFDELRRRMFGLLNEVDHDARLTTRSPSVPRANVYDDGKAFVVVAEVPGVAADDLEVTATSDTLSLRGKRRVETPEGFETHRRERATFDFARSIGFPVKVDPEQVAADMVDGVLTVKLNKVPEAQPRQITVGTN
mgnify:FL=1